MMNNEQDNQIGRRGLFAVNPKDTLVKSEFSQKELESFVSTIVNYSNGDYPPVPEIFIPVLNRLKDDAELIGEKTNECKKILQEIQSIQEEHASIKKEHETYLSDLISAHTEFDRALEIFQYHSIPMVLVGKDLKILDANDIFCAIFSVERSEITRQFPPLSKYIPIENSFSAPDGIIYTIITLNPPIVPFDHEASSLILLIPEKGVTDDIVTVKILPEIFRQALQKVLIPTAIIDQYNTVQFVNDALLLLLGRAYQDVHLRDLGSCGFSAELKDFFEEVNSSGIKNDFETTITRLDNSEIKIWINLDPVQVDNTNYFLLSAVPDEDESEEKTDPGLPVSGTYNPLTPDTFTKTLIDINPSPIVLFDKNGSIILANESLSELIGVSAELLNGQTLSDIGLKIPDVSQIPYQISVLTEKICVESPFGSICYSGLVISNNPDCPTLYILILQSTDKEEPSFPVSKEPQITVKNEVLVQQKSEPALCTESGLSFSLTPVPLVEYDGTQIIRINSVFRNWTGLSENNLSECVGTLISHINQVSLDDTQIFQMVFPSGTKYYHIVTIPNPDNPKNRCIFFIDNTATYEKLTEITVQFEDIKKELAKTRANLSNVNTPSMQVLDDISNQIDIVEFELSGGRYAMDIGMVREVVEMLPITPLPKTPPHFIGIINLRGEVTHVIDLGILLGEGLKKDRSGQKIIIVPSDAARGEHIGIIVDNVRSVTEIAVKQVTALGDEINTRINTRIKGIIKVTHDDLIDKREGEEKGDNLVIWLDMKEIISRLAGFN